MPDPQDATIEPRIAFMADVPLVGGVVNGEDPWHIPDNAVSELLNVDTVDATRPRRRQGYAEVGSAGTGLPSGGVPKTMGYLDVAEHSRLLLVGFENEGLFYISRPDNPSGWTETAIEVNSGLESLRMFQSDDLLWVVGSGGGVYALESDGNLIDTGNDTTSPPWSPVDGCYAHQRVFLFRNGLYWSKLAPVASDLEDKEAFDRTNNASNGGGYLSISSTFGRQEVAIRPWIKSSLILYYDRAIVAVDVNNSDPLLSAVEVLEPQFGCCSKFAIGTMGAEQYFADQYGNVRSLGLTVQAERRGVLPEALSERVKEELPGNVTLGSLHRIRFEMFDKWLWVFYPRGTSTDINACMRMHLERRTWDGPWVFADKFADIQLSNIDGTLKFYGVTTDGKVVTLFDGAWTDDGTAIEYRETTRAYSFGAPWTNKRITWAECEFDGDPGCVAEIYARAEEGDAWVKIKRRAIDGDAGDFPIWEIGEPDTILPLTETTDFPLDEITTEQTRGSNPVHQQDMDSDFALQASGFATGQAAFPLLGSGVGVPAGRYPQLRISESSSNGEFVRKGWALKAEIMNHRQDEDSE